MEKNKSRFSIVIVHKNGLDKIKKILDCLINIIQDADEIIVVDNNSSDSSIEYLQSQYKNIQLILNKSNLGYGKAANQGMNIATGKYFLILNNDLYLEKNSLDLFEKNFNEYKSAGMLTGQIYNFHNNPKRTALKNPNFLSELGIFKQPSLKIIGDKVIKIENMTGACIAVRRETAETAGMYDEDFFFYFEETEWCYRLKDYSWDIYLDPKIKVFHEGGGSSKRIIFSSRVEFLRSRLIFWKKIFSPGKYYCLVIFNYFNILLRTFLYFLLTILTLGLCKRLKYKFKEKVFLLAFLSFGMPKDWGIPKF